MRDDSVAEPSVARTFAHLLRLHRITAGLSQEELAERAQLSVKAIGALERGTRRAPYRTTVDVLARALDLARPERSEFETTAARARVRRNSAASTRERDGNLPAAVTSLVGRERELTELSALLAGHRLVTLTGSGGVGKTRLATVLAERERSRFLDGAWFIDLGPLDAGDAIASKIAAILGVPLNEREPVASLVRALRSRALLLVVDNCEHLVERAATIVAALLRGCPHMTVLATSRQRLSIMGEVPFRLAGLDVPSADAPCSAGDCQRYSAVRLFVERAQLADHRFELDAVRAPVVVEICRKLDGIPLAIEIGAAQMRILDAGELRRALDDRLASLSSGLADVPRRQQTLTAAIGWSYDLLDVRERSVFRRLATFAGGCSVEAAAGVCGGSGVDASALPAVLDALVDKSFVGVDGRSGARRYVLLESARQFGLAMLRTHDEYESAAMRQAQWAATFAQSMLRSSLTLPRDAWDVQFAREFDNLYAALHRMLEPGRDVSVAARILGGLRPYWSTRGGRAESYRLAIEVLDRLDVGKHPELAAGLHLVCSYYSFGADRLRSVRLATELYTQARSAFELARCYKQLAHAYSELGHLRKALQALGWASTFMTVCGIPDRQRMLQVCELRADLLQRHGSLDEARAQYRAGIDLAREFGDAVIEESCLASLAELDYFAGRLDAAIATFRHLVLSKHEAFRMHVYGHLSACYLQVGNVRAATESARIALAAEDALPLTRLVAIERLAHVATLTNDPIRAARLRGFVNEQFRRFEFVRDSFGSACAQTLSDALGERLTPDKIAVHARRGAKLSFERAVLEATPASTPERRSEILDVASADRPRQL